MKEKTCSILYKYFLWHIIAKIELPDKLLLPIVLLTRMVLMQYGVSFIGDRTSFPIEIRLMVSICKKYTRGNSLPIAHSHAQ